MEFKPHKYQELALDFAIRNKKSGLFLDMGLGKTVITLTLIDELMYSRFEIKKVLVIAPLRVAQSTWSTETQKWEHLQHFRISKILGSSKERLKALYSEADIYIINRENIIWLVGELSTSSSGGISWFFDMLVIDELSSFKDNKSKRFKELRKIIGIPKRILGLTGTPAPNGLINLWSQIYLLDQGLRLGKTITEFRNKYFRPNQRNGATIFNYKIIDGCEEQIKEKIKDVCLSMEAKDWIKIPDKIININYVELTKEEMESYRRLERDSYLQFKAHEITAVSAAALTTKLLQYANGAMYYDDKHNYCKVSDSKIDVLEEIVDCAQGKSLLIFYNFQHDADRIIHKFGKKVVKLKDDKTIDNWNKGKIEILLTHPASAGHGLNLQYGGNIIVWFGLTWSLELYLQANARLYRQGQQEAVIIHHLIAKGTADEVVMESLQSKEDVQSRLIESLKIKL
jgi:SNF2 family DNA or RNA helicase